MVAKDLISDTIPFITLSDSGEKALSLMDSYKVSHLPVLKENELVGIVAESDIYDAENTAMPIKEMKLVAIVPFVMEYQHLYEVIDLAVKLQLTVVPVLRKDSSYCGVVILRDIVKSVGDALSVQEPGGIVVLEMNTQDYALNEIARIVENNDAKILSSYVKALNGGSRIELTLKINKINVSSIMQTFRRFDYQIKTSFTHQDDMQEVMANRYNELMRMFDV